MGAGTKVQSTRVKGIRIFLYSRPESMNSGTLLKRTRVNGFCDHSTIEQFQWVLELYVLQTTRVNGSWNYSPVDQSQWGSGTIVQSTRVGGFWNCMQYRRPKSMGSGTIVQ